MDAGQDPFAVSLTKELGVTTYGATGQVSPEIVDGKETGRLITDGSFIKNVATTNSYLESVPDPVLGSITIVITVTTVVQTNVGKVIDPKQAVSNTYK